MNKAGALPHVLHVVGTPAGGIRLHIHTLLFGLKEIRQSYACSVARGDAGFNKDLPALKEALAGRLLDLNIEKQPALSDLPNIIRLARYVKEQRITIIHGHGAKGGAYARLVAAMCGVKAVYTPHGGSVHKMFSRLEETVYTAAEKFLFGFTSFFLFESRYSAEAYFDKVGRKPANFKVNYSGIPMTDLAAIQARSAALGYTPAPHSPPNIGVFAILRPQKGQLCAIRAMAELKKLGVGALLHLYGEGQIRPKLEKEAAAQGVAGQVVFHGDVGDPEAHMLAMDIVLIPSLFESFGYVAVEAFSIRKCVVASAVGGLKEIIRDGREGLLVEPADPAAIARACARLIAGPALAGELAANGYNRFTAEFTESKMLAGVKEVYAGLAAEKTPASAGAAAADAGPKTRGVAANTLMNLGAQALPLLVGIFTIPHIIQGLGLDRFGILTLAWMVIGYFSLFDLGLGRALTQIVANQSGKNDLAKLPGLVWTALAIMAVMGLVGAVLAGALSPYLISKVFKMPDQIRPEALTAFYLLSVSIPVVVLSSGFAGILAAYHRFDFINAVRLPLGLVTFVGPLLVLPFSNSLVPVIAVLAASRFAACAAQYLLCLRVMPALRGQRRLQPESIKPLFGFGGWMTVSNIISPLLVYLDRFIIGTLISVTAVAYYATPYEMITKLWVVPGALVATLFPAFAAAAGGDTGRTVRLFAKSIAATFLLIFPVALVVVVFAREGLTLWLGSEFAAQSATVLKLLSIGVFLNCLAQISYTLVQGRGRPDLTAKFHIAEFIFYLPLLLWGIKTHGIAGAAAVWVLRVAVDGLLLLWACQRLIPQLRRQALKTAGYMLLAAGALALCGVPGSLTLRFFLLLVAGFVFAVFGYAYLGRNNWLGLRKS